MLAWLIIGAWTLAAYRIADASNTAPLLWTLLGFAIPLFFEIAFAVTLGVPFIGLALGIVGWLVVFTVAKPAGA